MISISAIEIIFNRKVIVKEKKFRAITKAAIINLDNTGTSHNFKSHKRRGDRRCTMKMQLYCLFSLYFVVQYDTFNIYGKDIALEAVCICTKYIFLLGCYLMQKINHELNFHLEHNQMIFFQLQNVMIEKRSTQYLSRYTLSIIHYGNTSLIYAKRHE